ncbi:MAG: SIS domain-containing protein [Candidatus Sungbacteria bacterium]|nr:SIS domain-containing protein [Candidatus Sungbacteria bacterium]
MNDKINMMMGQSAALLQKTALNAEITQAVQMICDTLKRGSTVFACGNGGSMEQAMHIAGELVDRFRIERKPFPVVTLGTNAAVLTAWANDYDYKTAFRRELEALGRKGDCLIVLSTSGNSANAIEAVEAARAKGIATIGFLGEAGKLQDMADIRLSVPSKDTPRIQEVHMVLIHIICELVEEEMAHL